MASKNRILETMTMMNVGQYIRFEGDDNLMFFKTKRGMHCRDTLLIVDRDGYGREFIYPSQKVLAEKMKGKKCELYALCRKFWFEVG